MHRRGAALAALLAVLAASAPAVAASGQARLVVSGTGGQQVVLTVPSGGLRLDYPFGASPRLTGPDGTVGGLLIQRLPQRTLSGGLLLMNAPGFDQAVEIGLVGDQNLRLPPGEYALTLLGSQRQVVSLPLPQSRKDVRLATSGPIRRTIVATFGSGAAVHAWDETVAVPTTRNVVVVGNGSGGVFQQASAGASCFAPAAAAIDACVPPDEISVVPSPGADAAANWGASIYLPGSLNAASYRYSGRAAAVGAGTAAHSVAVISLPR